MAKLKWTYNNCKNEALKYETKTEFSKKSSGAYDKAWRMGWLNKFFPQKDKYSFEECKKIAEKYDKRSQLSTNDFPYYYVCKKNGWLDIFYGKNTYKPKNYWTYEKCMEEAKKFKCRSEFWAKSCSAYTKAKNNGWLDLYTWFETPKLAETIPEKNNYVYSYEDKEKKVAYIGRTVDIKRRHNQHNRMIKKTNSFDGIKQHFLNQGKELPNPKILEKKLTYRESQIKENFWVNFYKENGWGIINKAKTGLNSSSLGRTYIKWTYEKCMKESKKYKTKVDFKKGSSGAYSAAIRNKWIDDFTWLKRKTKYEKYTYEKCKEIVKNYETKSCLIKNNYYIYDIIRGNGWLYDFFPKENKF